MSVERGKTYVVGEGPDVKIDPETGAQISDDVVSMEEAMRIQEQLDALPDSPGPGTESTTVPEEPAEVTQEEPTPENPTPDEEPVPETTPESPEAPADLDKVITVGGISKPKKEWLAEAEADFGADLSGLPRASQDKIVDAFIAKSHKEAWAKANTKKSEEISHERKALEAKQAELATRRKQIQDREARLKKEAERISTIAAKEVKPEDLYDENQTFRPERMMEAMKVQSAKDRMLEIEQDLEAVKQEGLQAEADRLLAQVELLQETHPELATSEPIQSVITHVEKEGQVNHPDAKKLLAIYEVIDLADKYKVPVELAFEHIHGRTTSVPATAPKTQSINSAQEQLVRKIAGKQQAAPVTAPKGGEVPSRPVVKAKTSLGDKLREASSRAMGQASNPTLQKLGY